MRSRRVERGCALPNPRPTGTGGAPYKHPSPYPQQACATGEKLTCAQPPPQEADTLQARNPS